MLFEALPNELFEKIFAYCVAGLSSGPNISTKVTSDTHSPPISKNRGVHTGPVILAQVCSLWRSNVHSIPRLWTNIHITDPTEGRVLLFEHWLERSRPCLLHLVVRETGAPDTRTTTDQVLRLASSESARWRTLTLIIQSREHVVESLEQLETPNLQSMHLSIGVQTLGELMNPGKDREFHERLLSSPLVETVSIRNQWGQSQQPKLYPQVRSLYLYDLDYSILPSMLQRFNCIHFLDVHQFASAFSPDISPVVPITVHNLHTIHIATRHPYTHALGRFDVPSLRDLVIRLLPGPYGLHNIVPIHPRFFWFIGELGERSRCLLESFALLGSWTDKSSEIIPLFKREMFSQLKRLHLDSPVSITVIRAMTLDSDNNMIPQLEHLTFRGASTDSPEMEDAIKALVESRRGRSENGAFVYIELPPIANVTITEEHVSH